MQSVSQWTFKAVVGMLPARLPAIGCFRHFSYPESFSKRHILLLSVLVSACASTGDPSSPPAEWLPTQSAIAGDTAACRQPVGVFANSGESSAADKFQPTLAQLLFENQLRGYPVEGIGISAAGDQDSLSVTGVLGGVKLQESRHISPTANDCRNRWRVETNTHAVDSQLRTEAILWTAGLVMPLNEVYDSSLQLSDDGALLVTVTVRAWILGALLIPVRLQEHYWMRFSRLTESPQ